MILFRFRVILFTKPTVMTDREIFLLVFGGLVAGVVFLVLRKRAKNKAKK